jgi:hypothetical protein
MTYFLMNTREARIRIDEGTPDGTKGFGDQLYAEFDPAIGTNMRTKAGRRRLRRFINRLDDALLQYEARYGNE